MSALIFAAGSDPEDECRKAIKGYLNANGVKTVIDGEQRPPKTHIIVMRVEETRNPVPHNSGGQETEWHEWRVIIELMSDELSGALRPRLGNKSPKVASVTATLRRLFLSSDAAIANRNSYGIYTARFRGAGEERDGVTLKNPYEVTCQTFTYVE